MRKKGAIMTGIVLYVLLISTIAAVQATPAVVSVSPPAVNTTHGQIFTVNITVDPEGNEIYGAQYVLYFDTRILKALTQIQGTFLCQDGAKTNVFANETNNTIGKVVYAESRTGVKSGVTSPGVLASVSFEAIGTSGQCGLKLSDVKLSDNTGNRIEVETVNGECIIGEVTGKPVVEDKDKTVEEAHKLMEANPEAIILLDVRTKSEYETEHINMPGVELKNIPLSELETRLGELDKTKKVIVYCKTGVRSKEASEILAKHGFLVYNMLGGIEAWRINFREDIVSATPSPGASPIISHTPTPIPTPTSTPTTAPTTGGFEAIFAMTMLPISYLFIKRGRRGSRND